MAMSISSDMSHHVSPLSVNGLRREQRKIWRRPSLDIPSTEQYFQQPVHSVLGIRSQQAV